MQDILLKLMFSISRNCTHLLMIYLFLPERMKIEKVEKQVTTLHHKKEYVIHIINLKQGLSHGFVLKKVH